MFLSSFIQRKTISTLIACLIFVGVSFSYPSNVRAQSIVSCAAASASLGNAYITVNGDQAQVNVRSGPNSYQYGKIGFLLTYESAPALGRSIGGDWIQISCPGAPGGTGWVYSANVTLTAQTELPVIEIPATSTPSQHLLLSLPLLLNFRAFNQHPHVCLHSLLLSQGHRRLFLMFRFPR